MGHTIEHPRVAARSVQQVFSRTMPAIPLLIDERLPEQQAAEEIRIRVRRALDESAYRNLRQVKVHVNDRQVRLSGVVTRYYYKQRATAIVLPLDGVDQLRNELKVAARDGS